MYTLQSFLKSDRLQYCSLCHDMTVNGQRMTKSYIL